MGILGILNCGRYYCQYARHIAQHRGVTCFSHRGVLRHRYGKHDNPIISKQGMSSSMHYAFLQKHKCLMKQPNPYVTQTPGTVEVASFG